jgi:hypothetical protein
MNHNLFPDTPGTSRNTVFGSVNAVKIAEVIR